MASVTIHRAPPTPPEIERVVLELDEEEAQLIRGLLYTVQQYGAFATAPYSPAATRLSAAFEGSGISARAAGDLFQVTRR